MPPISPDELAEWERVTNEATEGPWEAYSAPCCPDMGGVDSKTLKICHAAIGRVGHPMELQDAEFCALAREAMPRLIAAYRELRWPDACACGKFLYVSNDDDGREHAPARLGGCWKGEG